MSYCTKTEVNSVFGDISDQVSDEMFTTAINNSTAWIDSNLKKNYVPIPEIIIQVTDDDGDVDVGVTETTTQVVNNLINVPDGLRTAAIYHSASDILLSLYHGDELPIQYDVWFNKAQSLLEDYISAYLKADADEEDLVKHQMVKHSHGLTYRQRRSCKRWVR